MKHEAFIIILLLTQILSAGPQAPVFRKLSEKEIIVIPIHTEVNTLLVFPEPFTQIFGAGLTDGQTPGLVQCQQSKNDKLIVLQQLEPKSDVLMQVVMADKVYTFRLTSSENPASVINFGVSARFDPAKTVPAKKAESANKPLSPERLRDLIALTQKVAFLGPQLPKEYEGFESKAVSYRNSTGALTTRIEIVARFQNEDALVFIGKVRNEGERTVLLSQCIGRMKVGSNNGQGDYGPNLLIAKSDSLAPGKEVSFQGILVGDGRGGAAHFSLKNQIELSLQPQN